MNIKYTLFKNPSGWVQAVRYIANAIYSFIANNALSALTMVLFWFAVILTAALGLGIVNLIILYPIPGLIILSLLVLFLVVLSVKYKIDRGLIRP